MEILNLIEKRKNYDNTLVFSEYVLDTVIDYEDIEFDIPFSKYASVRRGLTTGYNAMYINPAFKKNESKKTYYHCFS